MSSIVPRMIVSRGWHRMGGLVLHDQKYFIDVNICGVCKLVNK